VRGTASFTIRIPHASGSLRKPAFVSPNTNSLRLSLTSVNGSAPNPAVPDVVVPLTPSSPGCSDGSGYTTCSASVAAVIGSDDYTLTLYASADGSGSSLATATVNANVVQGVATNVSVTFGGVPATIVLSKSLITAGDDGLTHTATFTVSALDASGATILLPGNYSSPIALAISGDPNGALSLSTNSVAEPGAASGSTTVTLTYNSTKPLTEGTITASSAGANAALHVIPIVVSPSSLHDMFAGQSSKTLTISEAGYSGAFAISGVSAVASVSCTPSSCVPSSSGGSVTVTLTPTAAGSATLSVGDTNGGTASVTIGVGAATPSQPISSSTLAPDGYGFVTAPNGDLFVAGNGKVYYFNPTACSPACTVGSFSYSVGQGYDLEIGPDGNLYALGNSNLDVVSLSACPPTCSPVKLTSFGGFHMAFGGDGNLWVINFSTTVERVTTAGVSTAFTFTGFSPNFIAEAPDGTLWFTDNSDARIGHFDPRACTSTCSITTYALTKAAQANGITATSSGTIWIAERGASYVAEIVCNPTCALTEYQLSPSVSNASWIESLPDGLIFVNDLAAGENDVIDPLACAAGTCNLALQTGTSFKTFEAAYGSDGAVWGGSGTIFRQPMP
jgi:streptogramin lyase